VVLCLTAARGLDHGISRSKGPTVLSKTRLASVCPLVAPASPFQWVEDTHDLKFSSFQIPLLKCSTMRICHLSIKEKSPISNPSRTETVSTYRCPSFSTFNTLANLCLPVEVKSRVPGDPGVHSRCSRIQSRNRSDNFCLTLQVLASNCARSLVWSSRVLEFWIPEVIETHFSQRKNESFRDDFSSLRCRTSISLFFVYNTNAP
jgi:hypothetical protein